MPLAKIHVLEGRYDEQRLANVSTAIQEALISVLKIPSDDFFQIILALPRHRFLPGWTSESDVGGRLARPRGRRI